MGQEAYLSEIMALTSTQQEALFGNLMRLGARRDLHGRKIRWDELPVLYPELATYNAPTLRHYIQLFGSLWMVRNVEVDDEGFTQDGFTEWGENRRKFGMVGAWKVIYRLLAGFGLICLCQLVFWMVDAIQRGQLF